LVTCSWSEERFERYIDGNVIGAERDRLLAHVDECTSCRGLLEELRVVDGLLIGPRAVELPSDFTSATMAGVHALPEPVAQKPCVAAWLVSFLVAGWALIGAASLIMPTTMLAAGAATVRLSRDVLPAMGAVGHALMHLGSRGNLSTWTAAAAGVVFADCVVVVALLVLLRIARPRFAERLRW
jgi:anti-sigma factor RsiW